MMEDWFMKLPALPKGGKEGIVTVTPWIALVFGILGILIGLFGFGIFTAFSPLMMMGGGMYHAGGGLLAAGLLLVSSVLLLLGFQGTHNHKLQGWNMLFWSNVVSTLGSLIAIFSGGLGGLIANLIIFYLLYQIKSYYK